MTSVWCLSFSTVTVKIDSLIQVRYSPPLYLLLQLVKQANHNVHKAIRSKNQKQGGLTSGTVDYADLLNTTELPWQLLAKPFNRLLEARTWNSGPYKWYSALRWSPYVHAQVKSALWKNFQPNLQTKKIIWHKSICCERFLTQKCPVLR